MSGTAAVLFDMDGVLVDSEGHWAREMEVCYRSLVDGWTQVDKDATTGVGLSGCYAYLKEHCGLALSEEDFRVEMEAVAMQVYDRAELMAQAIEVLKALRARGMLIGLGSSSQRSWVERVLEKWGLHALFDTVITADDVRKAKPAPDIYLSAAEELHVTPSNCLVVEDADSGIRAAKAAGMTALGLRTEKNKGQTLAAANRVITHLPEILDLL